MATSAQVASNVRTVSPLALWHLLSLDAPTVATLWVWFIARTEHIHLGLASPAAMALAVWILYAADRLLDTRKLGPLHTGVSGKLEERHFFHHRHRRGFLLGIAVAAISLFAILHLLDANALHLYLVEAVLLCIWFVILHATRSAHRLPKEITVGIFFAAAVFIPTVARNPNLRSSLALAAILFGATCSLNCLFLYAWEHESAPSYPKAGEIQAPHFTTRAAIACLPILAMAVASVGASLARFGALPARAIAMACIITTAVLFLLHRNRQYLSPVHLRAAADLALLTPLLLLPFLR